MSDRMEQHSLDDPIVLASLREFGFASVWIDGTREADRYQAWIGGGEGTGIAILDPQGRCYAARPGAQDPAELVALLATAASQREPIAVARQSVFERSEDPIAAHQLGVLLLELGCRVESKQLLQRAAAGGVSDARHRLARLFALDGSLTEAEEWLRGAPVTPASRVTVGYFLYLSLIHI